MKQFARFLSVGIALIGLASAATAGMALGAPADNAAEPTFLTFIQGGPTDPDGLLGDLNADGIVSAGDIDAFVMALTSPAEFELAYPASDLLRADTNGDGSVNSGDIDAFVSLLTGSPQKSQSPAPVPSPTATMLGLAGVALLAVLRRQR